MEPHENNLRGQLDVDGLKGFSMGSNKKFLLYAILVLIVLLVLAFGTQILHYASCFLGATTLFALLRGQMRALTVRYKWKKRWAAGLLTLEAIFFFFIPLGAIVGMLIDIFSKTHIDFNAIYAQFVNWGNDLQQQFGVDLFTFENLKNLSGVGQNILRWLLTNVSSMVINSILMVFVLFYMLYQREAFEQAVMELLPFSRSNKKIVISETQRIIMANALGIPVLAIIQGAFAYLGYLLFGIDNALFYGVLTAFATIIPLLGTMIVWIPLTLVFVVQGNWLMAIGLGIYGLIVIGGVDNVARFILQKRLADIHPLITVFGVIFGMSIFGFWGVIFGPLLISMLILFLNMFRHDYVPGSKAQRRITMPMMGEQTTSKRLERIIRERSERTMTASRRQRRKTK